MNNVLDYKGYRFFQASYDTDELGTVLSVNHDRLGTISYLFRLFINDVGNVFCAFWKSVTFSFYK